MICLENIRSGILDIQKISLPKGITVITGDNGSGKTTFLRICTGMDIPKTGNVTIDGKNPRDCEVGYVSEFPDRHMIFSIVRDEIASPLRLARKNPELIRETVAEIADLAGIAHMLDRDCKTLSGGEKMLTGIATALIAKPDLLVMDEPDSHLDGETAIELLCLIQKSGCPYVLWSTHSRKIIEKADQILELTTGREREP